MPIVAALPAIISTAATVYGAVSSADAQRKAANAAQDAAHAQVNANGTTGLDIAGVNTLAQNQAIQNAINSAALEKALNPLAPQLRDQSLQAVIDGLKASPYESQVQSGLLAQFNTPDVSISQSALSQAAQAEALKQLQLGGKLDTDTANQIIRSSAANAGHFGNTLGLGRDVSARDLGLSSLALEQQRLANAQSYGAQQDAYGLSAAQLALSQQQGKLNLGLGLSALGQQGYQRALSAAQLGQSIQQPVTGLDPSSIANLAVGNYNQQNANAQNAAAIQASSAQGQSQLGSQLLGYGLSGLNNYFKNINNTSNLGTASSAYDSSVFAPVNNVGSADSSTGSMFCWVAREAYGHENPEWLDFRNWILTRAPEAFRDFYGAHGEEIAAQIKDQGLIKELIRHLMNSAKLT